MSFYNPIKLRIHCWGGFGSQLHAYFLVLGIKQFTKRKVILVFHNSGITRRELEIEPFLSGIDFRVVNDYTVIDKIGKSNRRFIFNDLLVRVTKSLLFKLQIVSNFEKPNSLYSLHFWTLSLRGHYTNIKFDSNFYKNMIIQLLKHSPLNISAINGESSWIIHYRLGDLLHANKNIISSTAIARKLQEYAPTNYIHILSDSPSVALELLEKEFKSRDIVSNLQSNNLETLATLLQSIFVRNFLGTSSKVSIWITVFRIVLDSPGITAMPISLKNNLERLLDCELVNKINFYTE